MKIASFAFRSYPAKGGVEIHLKQLSEYLTKQGHESTIYTSRSLSNEEFLNISLSPPFIRKKTKNCELKYYEKISDIVYKRFDIVYRFYSYNKMRGLYETFEKEIKTYDLIHLHGLNMYNNYVLSKISHRNNKPVILTCHDVTIAPNLSLFAKILKKMYDKYVLKKMDKYVNHFITNTKDQLEILKRLGINERKISVIPVGIEPPQTIIEHEGKILKRYNLKKTQYVINIGRIEEYKGIDDILTISKEFNKTKFVIIGKGEYSKNIEKRIKEENIKNIRILSEIDNQEKMALLKNAKIFLFPSKNEGWGIVLAEAMSYGVPCIAYDIPNVRTVFTNKKSGFLIKNIDEMKEKIEILLKNDDEWRKLSKNSKKEAEQYNYKKSFEKIIKKYEGLIKK